MNKNLKFSVKIALLAFGVMSLLSALAEFFLRAYYAAGIFLAIGIVCIFAGLVYGKSDSLNHPAASDVHDSEKQNEKEMKEES